MQAADECYNHGFTFNKSYTEKKLANQSKLEKS